MRRSAPYPQEVESAPSIGAAALYSGQVMHQRMKPVGHRFRYKVFSLLVDLDRLGEADAMSGVFSVNRRNLLSFYEKDHTGVDGLPLRQYADSLLRDAGLPERPARILLVCYPRIFGRVFNPIAVYYAYDDQDRLLAMIYEVRNTFGERHTYVCPLAPDQMSKAGIRQECDKIFHVSPFVPMRMRYHFRMVPPGEVIRWRILETDAEGPLLAATFSGERLPLSTRQIFALVAKIPHLTVKIVAGIHWEALRLWVKGVRYRPRPAAPEPVSIWKNDRRVCAVKPDRFSGETVLGEPAE